MSWILVLWMSSSTFVSVIQARNIFNQTAGYQVAVNFDTWSNFGPQGGCVPCPYTCIRPTEGPNGVSLNFTNSTQIASLPAAYSQVKQNGCCYAAKSKTTQEPSCSQEANPPEAEDCGFLYGPTLEWKITSNNPPKKRVSAIMFASIDCLSFWAVGESFVKQDPKGVSGLIDGKEMINGGCYGNPQGVPIVMAGCLTSELKFDKDKAFTWEMLAEKCQGLSGQCSRTNGVWGRNLKCCTDLGAIKGSDWDLFYKEYTKEVNTGTILSGPAIFGVVIGGVALMMLLVHYGAKLRERAHKTTLLRQQESSEEYDELLTPYNSGEGAENGTAAQRQQRTGVEDDLSVEVSLHEGDDIFKPRSDEVLYEGNL